MSRIAKAPIELPSGVEIKIADTEVSVKGPNGSLVQKLHPMVSVEQEDKTLTEKKLKLVGVGYRAQVQGTKLTLALGYSHPIEYTAPEGVTIEVPSQTEIVVKGCDKQKVGQVASEIRSFRSPEPYKGKGVRYFDERVVRKEAKKA